MGTTLANIHVYRQDTDAIKNLLPDEYVIQDISKDWVTILNRSLMEKDPDKVARKLSKSVASPLLCFLYFDDDLMALSMFKQGKRIASYAMNYGCEPYLKNCKVFVNELEYDPNSWTRLRKIFKCNDLGKKLDMLEEFFGVALYIDVDFLDDGYEKFIRLRDDSIYKDYEEKQRKLNKIKNKFNVTLTQEVDGDLKESDPVIINLRGEEGKYSIRGQYYKKVNDEVLPIDGFQLQLRPWDSFLCVNDNIVLDRCYTNGCERYKNDGTLVKIIIIPSNFILERVLANGDIICLTSGIDSPQYNRLARYSDSGEMIWCFDGEVCVPKLICDYIYFETGTSYKDKKYVKLDLDGNIIFSKTISHIESTRDCRLINGCIYTTYRKYTEEREKRTNCHFCFVKMNDDLECLDMVELEESLSVFDINVIDTIRNKVYCCSLDNSIVAIDLDTMEYISKKFDCEIYLNLVDKDGYLYGTMGGGCSTVCVFDSELNLVSRHRVKGDICDFYETGTGIHVITSTGNGAGWGFDEGQCLVRIYRFDMIN